MTMSELTAAAMEELRRRLDELNRDVRLREMAPSLDGRWQAPTFYYNDSVTVPSRYAIRTSEIMPTLDPPVKPRYRLVED